MSKHSLFTSAGFEMSSQWAWLCLAGALTVLVMRYHYVFSFVLPKLKAQLNPFAAQSGSPKGHQDVSITQQTALALQQTLPKVKEDVPKIAKPLAANTIKAAIPKRLIICVDGTWGGPDGTLGNPQGNISTVFRVYASVKEGIVTDEATGKRWRQQRQYFDGLANKKNPMKNILAGAFGAGIEDEIKRVYEYCCRHASGPDDEIYFFGFSRGAFTVRAVANLLCYMHVPKDLHNFSEHYEEMLRIYPSVRSWNKSQSGQAHLHFSCSKKPPVVRFIGAFDTVKAFKDEGLYDVLPHPNIQHYRHALALNEDREEFKPETAIPDIDTASSEHSILQAWFVGTHEDLGGANSKDGLSLYPLQWILSEAESLGLTIGFQPIELECTEGLESQERFFMDNPIDLVMPPKSQRQRTSNNQSEMSLKLENGITVRVWDLCDIHEKRKDEFKVKLNSSHWGRVHKVLWTIKTRRIFDQDSLTGYCLAVPVGTFIHPLVYQVLDENPSICNVARGWGFWDALTLFRHRAIPDEGEIFWEHPSPAMKKRLQHVRILICGAAGVGKSSLVNKVLKGNFSQVNANTHQQHDVAKEITGPGLPYIIHDSEGFQPGATNKEANAVRDFLRMKSREPKLPLRVHTIWYCILAGTERESRPSCESDIDLFKVLNDCKSTIPVIVICTKVDKLRATYRGELYEEEYDDQLPEREHRRIIETKVTARVDLFKDKIKKAFEKSRQGYPYMAGPIFTSEKDAKSIKNLVGVTYNNLSNDQVRAMFSQAQGVDVELKVKEAIKESLRLYKHAVRTSAVPILFSGCASTTVVAPMIVSAVYSIFNFQGISGDIAWRCMKNVLVSNTTANVAHLFAQALGVAGGLAAETGVGLAAGTAMLASAAAVNIISTPQFSRALLMCALDTIIIMDHAFWQCDNDQQQVEKKDIDKSAQWFNNGRSSQVHEDIRSLIQIWNPFTAFDYKRIENEMNAIVERYRYRPEQSCKS